jgi:hypothetical protein
MWGRYRGTLKYGWTGDFDIRGCGKNIKSSKFYPFLYFRIAKTPILLNISVKIPGPTSRISLPTKLGTTVFHEKNSSQFRAHLTLRTSSLTLSVCYP